MSQRKYVIGKVGILAGLLSAAGAIGWFASEWHLVRADGPTLGSSDTKLTAQGFRATVKQVLPSVVNIASERTVKAPQFSPQPPGSGDPWGFFDYPFRWRFDVPRERRERGLGSGVIAAADGDILTNAHVVRNAMDIKVTLADKREFKAKVIGTDDSTDLALLKIEATGLPAIKIGDSSKVEPGDLVLAMGNPFGLSQTVTLGIVSAVGRAGLGIEDYEDFIQTDAAINPGNSGGPLVDPGGSMIGINTAIFSRSGGSQGIGFAIPSALAVHVMEQLKSKGKVTRGWLGVSIQPVDAAVAKAFGLKEPKGTLVGDVTSGSPAAKVGIKRGDVILELNGQEVPDSRELRMKISLSPPGSKVNLKIFRDGKELTVPVELGELREDLLASGRSQGDREGAMRGVEVDELTPAVARQLGLEGNVLGVVVTSVAPASPAEEAGLRKGDVILEANRKTTTTPAAFRSALSAVSPASAVTLLINRGGHTLYIVIEPR